MDTDKDCGAAIVDDSPTGQQPDGHVTLRNYPDTGMSLRHLMADRRINYV